MQILQGILLEFLSFCVHLVGELPKRLPLSGLTTWAASSQYILLETLSGGLLGKQTTVTQVEENHLAPEDVVYYNQAACYCKKMMCSYLRTLRA